MSEETLTIKAYPTPQKDIPGSTSRFTKSVDKGGDGELIETVGPVDVNIPNKDFVYNEETKTGEFAAIPGGSTRKKTIRPYIPTKELKSLIRLAQIIQRPILVKGEPGCGKTQLSKAVAFEWYGQNYEEHFFEWHIKSSSKAVDGLYTFDHLKRLREAHIAKNKSGDNGGEVEEEDLKKYRTFGPLAKAFLTSKPGAPSIILIDEIDKADIDFPNDLLLELDENRFTIPETGELIQAAHPPLVFITSNDEREMPEAFLRRCLFMYLKFPEVELLKRIIGAHLPGLMKEHEDFVSAAIERFKKLRTSIDEDVSDNKRVSTSELLDWLKAYQAELKEGVLKPEHISQEEMEDLPLFYQALLKTYEGLRRENKLKDNV